jgi:hypothetical protein
MMMKGGGGGGSQCQFNEIIFTNLIKSFSRAQLLTSNSQLAEFIYIL